MMILLSLGSAVVPADSWAAPPTPQDDSIVSLLKPIRERHHLPGLVGGFVHNQRLAAAGAIGVRKHGTPEPITVNDLLHLGSCTKAMTASMIATLIEEKKLSWDTTLGDVFPDLKGKMLTDWTDVTLLQLFTHRSGLPANGPYFSLGARRSTTEQRQVLLAKVLARKPEEKPGTKYVYSNLGYILAGAMAEKVTGVSWEDLMRQRLFRPLGMDSAGFGPPGTKEQVDPPWGHIFVGETLVPLQKDNPGVLGPAGTVHCTLRDWASFAALHLNSGRPSPPQGCLTPLLLPASFTRLHTPPSGEEYACGWGVVPRRWAGGKTLTHNGSNTMWFAVVWLAPQRQFGVLAVTNVGGKTAAKACDEAAGALIGHYEKYFSSRGSKH
jgi:CubicO group peptidase (beta-lactamase class C family)